MSLTKLCKPSETTLRQLFNRQLFWICVLSSNGEMAPNSAVSHEIGPLVVWYLVGPVFVNLRQLAVNFLFHQNNHDLSRMRLDEV